MARKPTTFSRVSTGYKNSKNTIGESGYDLGFIDGYGTNLTLAGDLTVTASDISIYDDVTVQSDVTIRGQLTVDGGFLSNSGNTFKSNVSIGGGLTVRSNTTFQASNVTISGGLTVDSNATFNSGLTVKGQGTFAGVLCQSGLTAASTVSVTGLLAGATAAFSSGVTTGALYAGGVAAFNSTVTAAGVGTFAGIRNQSNYTGLSNTSLAGGLTVQSGATFDSNVTIAGSLCVDSYSTFKTFVNATSGFTTAGLIHGATGAFSSAVTVTGPLYGGSSGTFVGMVAAPTAAFSSYVTATGGLAAAGAGLSVGGGEHVVAISNATAAVSLGAINPLESSSFVTAALSGATRGDIILIGLDSIYALAAGNTDVTWCASSSSTVGEVNIWGVNSTLTAVTPTASTVVRLVRLNFASFV